ncbi:MAG: hypothetical protein C0482_05105 [Gordonia sp.]|nr:hypothetical protein [Gordonia sp. (in: high G+C Gram-positive bacteria)]
MLVTEYVRKLQGNITVEFGNGDSKKFMGAEGAIDSTGVLHIRDDDRYLSSFSPSFWMHVVTDEPMAESLGRDDNFVWLDI